jgi:hypothetical protein
MQLQAKVYELVGLGDKPEGAVTEEAVAEDASSLEE